MANLSNPDEPVTTGRLVALGAEVSGEDFSSMDRVHDWRNHIAPSLRTLWSELSDETRGALRLTAEVAASEQEWE